MASSAGPGGVLTAPEGGCHRGLIAATRGARCVTLRDVSTVQKPAGYPSCENSPDSSIHSLEPAPREYRLRFYHTHTNERLDIVYRRGETYIPEALAEIDHYLRDHHTGEVRHSILACSTSSTT
jgi:uncharacterized protein YcbK (DUF882 family)